MVLARDPGIVRQHPADAQHRNFLSVNVLHVRLEGLVNIAPRSGIPDLMALQMGNRVQHGLLAIVQDVVVRQRYAVDSRVYQALERVRLRTESKGFIRDLAANGDRRLQVGKRHIRFSRWGLPS